MPEELLVIDPDGAETVVLHWTTGAPLRGVVQILHGWGEHAGRYDRLAGALTTAGYEVYADDHHGHGRTGVRNDTLGALGPRGQDGVVDACHAVSTTIHARHPRAPLFVLGHSWGSMILQRYLRSWGAELTGAIMSGTTYLVPEFVPDGDLNKGFEGRTVYDWLTRDPDEVDKYIADPHCGFEMMKPGTVLDFVPLTAGDDAALPRSLPILIVNGELDPIGGERGGQALAEHYRAVGLTDVTFRSYPGGRHELFNETNRDEVTADVVAWLDAHTSRRP